MDWLTFSTLIERLANSGEQDTFAAGGRAGQCKHEDA